MHAIEKTREHHFGSQLTVQWIPFTLTRLVEMHTDKHPDHPADYRFIIFDIETSGLDFRKHQVIEVFARLFRVELAENHNLIRAGSFIHQMSQPFEPLTEEIVRLTGLTDEMLEGKQFELEELQKFFDQAEFAVAHNAQFDKSFLEKLGIRLPKVVCSMNDIPWEEYGYTGRKLDYLALMHGFIYEAHRAENDVDALGLLLSFENSMGIMYADLLREASQQNYVELIVKPTFDEKDLVKNRKYRWDPDLRAWTIRIAESKLSDEIVWLKDNLQAPKIIQKPELDPQEAE